MLTNGSTARERLSGAEGRIGHSRLERAGGALLQDVTLFDVYEGKPIPAGQKSLAYHLTFQSPGKTLTDRVVRKNRERIVQQLRRQIGARLRDA